jgi:hypothetical protein
MRYLSLALYAEGPTDDRFLSPLLQRLCIDICLSSPASVEVNEVFPLDTPPGEMKSTREDRIVEAAKKHQGGWNILFIHSDGANDPGSAARQQIEPALARLRETGLGNRRGVPVVPVRETESWLLADGDTLREIFGTRLSNSELGLPANPAWVESIGDPKRTIEEVFAKTGPTGKRARAGAKAWFHQIGERIDLDQLRQVRSFRALETDLKAGLSDLGIC